MSGLGLTKRDEELIRDVLRRHPEIEEARIFGSRAKGTAGATSDVNLALLGRLSTGLLATIAGELEDLPMPFTFDLQAYDQIHHRPLLEHIDRVGVSFYRPSLSQK